MNTLKELVIMFQKNPKAIFTTIGGCFAGACMGAVAYFNGWLG